MGRRSRERRDGQIETGRWYRVRARCEGPRVQVWLDDQLVIDYTDDGKGPIRGRAGVGTWQTQAQFRNFKVTSLDGKTLHEGLPPLPEAEPGIAPAWRPFGSAKVTAATDKPLNGSQCRQIESVGGIRRAGAATVGDSRRRSLPRLDLGSWRSRRRTGRAVGGRR